MGFALICANLLLYAFGKSALFPFFNEKLFEYVVVLKLLI